MHLTDLNITFAKLAITSISTTLTNENSIWETRPGDVAYFDGCQSDYGVHGPILHSEGVVPDLTTQKGHGVSHEYFGGPETLLGR
jgi:NADH:ubiquinone oxidoreductase subunit D